MKNTITVLVLALAAGTAGTSLAQESAGYREHFTAGLKLGTNFSNVYDSEGEDFEAEGKFGFAGGAFFSIPIGRLVGIQPEILFSQKGFRSTGTFLGSPL